jgi:uncharacterized protein involved in response to NO
MMAGVWRREPFRVFFPLGTALAWAGIGHWVAYWAGWIGTYSCLSHGLVQVQGFLMAFAVGFLLTAIPRRTETAPPSGLAVAGAAIALVGTAVAAFLERWWVAEAFAAALVLGIVAFAARRFVAATAGRRPPAAFVLIPLGLACALAGGGLLASGDPAAMTAGRLLVQQGLFFCLVMGAAALVLPLMGGATPPPDLGSSPAVARAALAYGAAGIAVVASLVAEAAGSDRIAPVLRGVVVAAALAWGAGLRLPLDRPGWNRRVARAAAWMVPLGPILAGLAPDYRVPALHVTFVGGFGLLAVAVATHVTASHCDLPRIRDGRAPVVAIVAVAVVLAMAGRLIADATDAYFEHLAAAGALWIAGTGLWAARLLPVWLRRG